MKAILFAAALLASIAAATAPVQAANADQPNANVDKSNDAGGDTGNGKVEQLNNAQTDAAQKGTATPAQPPPK